MLLLYFFITILQIFLLPGLVALGRLRALHWIDRVLLAIPVSFLVNYLIVVALVLAGGYTQLAMRYIFVIEVAALIVLNRHVWNKLPDLNLITCNQLICKITNFCVSFKKIFLNKEASLEAIVFLISLGLLAYLDVFSLWYGQSATAVHAWTGVFSWWYSQLGTVISDWDGVVSWHRWAVSWYNGEFPVNYWTYPQVMPSLYSITYKFINSSEIYLAPKLVPIFLCAVIPITAIRLAYLVRQIACSEVLLSIPIFFYLVFNTVYPDYAFSGGADMAMGYWGVLTIYCVTLSKVTYSQSTNAEYRQVMFWLAVITSTSFIVKQVGIFATTFFPVGWYWVTKNFPIPKQNRLNILLVMGVLAVLIPAHWYLYVFLKSSNPIGDISIYEPLLKSPWYLRPYEGAKMLYAQLGWWPLAFLILGGWIKAFRILLLPLLTVFLAWSLYVSYDTRNLYIVLPLFAFLMAAGIVLVIKFVTNKLFHVMENVFFWIGKKFPLLKSRGLKIAYNLPTFVLSKKIYGPLVMILLAGTTYYVIQQNYYTFTQALNKSFREQLKIGGGEGMNHYLYDVFRKKYAGTGVLIGTDNQMMAFVPKLREFYYPTSGANRKDFSAVFLNKRVRFLLTIPSSQKEVAEYLDAGQIEGKYKLLHEASGYRLFEIVEPENNCREYLRLNPASSWGKCE